LKKRFAVDTTILHCTVRDTCSRILSECTESNLYNPFEWHRY